MAVFKVRARTVDMLGRQQIAGIPTAISELFKNAHDAYARNVEVDYFRDENLFVLRDDGLGMTRDDFEQRWLTLGTESKVGGVAGMTLPPIDPDQDERPVLGEKGIGRLAVAIIGPQVFALSRAKRNGTPADRIVGAYIHWGVFELPSLDLQDVLIPLREFDQANLPDRGIVKDMTAEAASALDRISHQTDLKRLQQIRKEMAAFDIDPQELDADLGSPSLRGKGHGTHFFIKPADPIIQADIDSREGEGKATKVEKHLLGFTNTMTPGHKKPPIIARFRDYVDEGAPHELIGENAFFTPDEYREVDHHVTGRFDEYGQFQGVIGIYQMEPEGYVLSWNESDGSPTLCGPFSFSFAYMQGSARDSLVPPEEHSRMKRKLDRHGGMYIYRDGVRVQPYGDSDYDWLDVERRRTLSAAYYFYSYRRMFGAIQLTRAENGQLTEKAGREGFRENKAYRQFRSILMNFFSQTAGDFFRDEGKHAEMWEAKKEELNRLEEVRRKKAKQVTVKRRELQENLNSFFDSVDRRNPEEQAKQAIAELQRKAERIIQNNAPLPQKAMALMRVEKEGREALHELRQGLTVTRPRAVGLSRKLGNEWTAYASEIERLEKNVFLPAEAEIEGIVSSLAQESKLPLDHLIRLDAAVKRSGEEALRVVRRLRKDNEESLADIAKKARETTRKSFKAVSAAVDESFVRLESMKRASFDVDTLSDTREELENKIGAVFEEERDRLERLREQLSLLSGFWEESGYDAAELTEALEEEIDALREQRDSDLEMAQIGMALSTISHEFEKTVGSLRDGFRRMKAWAEANPELHQLYADMRSSFDHLDSYLTMFTPFDRRLYRSEVTITGKGIFTFLKNLFGERVKRHNIVLKPTDNFLDYSIKGYPSSFYPVFVNLVDNAIFWLQRIQDRPREIELDFCDGDLLVRDNGPGVSARDWENIFALHFSRKPGGRGMGLYISREVLAKVGYKLTLDTKAKAKGAIFRISPINPNNDD